MYIYHEGTIVSENSEYQQKPTLQTSFLKRKSISLRPGIKHWQLPSPRMQLSRAGESKPPLTFWCSETLRNSVVLFGNSHVGLLGDCRWFKGSPRKGFLWFPTSPHHQLIEPTMESVGRTFKMGVLMSRSQKKSSFRLFELAFFSKAEHDVTPLYLLCFAKKNYIATRPKSLQ